MIDRRALGVRFLQLAATLAVAPAAVAQPLIAPAGSDVVDGAVFLPDLKVEMRDGVRLATDLYLPSSGGHYAQGPFPTILERTPYGKSQAGTRHASAGYARRLAEQGYAVVFQDCRGRGGSEGEYVKYVADGADGYDCCAWIVAQRWSNGKIGAQGLSYGAHTAIALASAGAPGLAALFVDSGGFSNAYQGGIRQGGAFELKQVTWALNAALESPDVIADPARLAALKAVDIRAWFARMPWSRGDSPLSLAPEYESYVFDQWEAGAFDDGWRRLGLYAEGHLDAFSHVPTFWMSSWYDPYPRTATDNFSGLVRRGRSEQRLVLGPWTHGNNHQTHAGDVDFGPAATLAGEVAPDLFTLRRRWFDRHLKGEGRALAAEPKVRLFVMGGGTGRRRPDGRLDHGGRWRAETAWPPAGARPTVFHLHADGQLSAAAPPSGAAARSFRYDPRRPVPTIGGTITSGAPVMVGGAFDQREGAAFFGSEQSGRPLADRPDVLVFQTPPLQADVEVTGPVHADLWIASDGPDTDFTIKLIDVHPPGPDDPDGYAMNLTDGILRCRYRRSWTEPSTLEPGVPTRVRVSAFPTSNLFKAGHRIRLDVSSSNYPHFDLNPNTGAPEGRWRDSRIAVNTVFVDAARPSSVTLPIVPT